MSNEFRTLKNLICEGKYKIVVSRQLVDPYGIWLYISCIEKPSIINLFGTATYIYTLTLGTFLKWLWIPLGILLGYYVKQTYFLLLWIPILIPGILKTLGNKLIPKIASQSESAFDLLWRRQAIALFSTETSETMSIIDSKPIPLNSILPSKDWRIQILNINDL